MKINSFFLLQVLSILKIKHFDIGVFKVSEYIFKLIVIYYRYFWWIHVSMFFSRRYCEWLNFCGVPIFVFFVEGHIQW